MSMPISDRIKAAREAAGLTQKELGERMGVSDASIAQYESGKRNPKLETLQRIADALGLDAPALHGVRKDENGALVYGGDPLVFGRRERLLASFDDLNEKGQAEAIKRTEELAQIPKYQASDKK